jgi:surface polysaccharide O-acyltransferase-like enzyme
MALSQPYISRFNPQVDLHYFAGYAGYLVLGHYLAFKEFGYKHLLKWVFMLFAGILVIIVYGTYLLYKYNTGLITLLYEPVGPSIVLLASAVFLIGRFSVPKVPSVINRIRDFASPYNYGIYLSHALVLYLLDLLGVSYKMCMPLVSIPVTAITCFILSLLLTWLISRLPWGKWISG